MATCLANMYIVPLAPWSVWRLDAAYFLAIEYCTPCYQRYSLTPIQRRTLIWTVGFLKLRNMTPRGDTSVSLAIVRAWLLSEPSLLALRAVTVMPLYASISGIHWNVSSLVLKSAISENPEWIVAYVPLSWLFVPNLHQNIIEDNQIILGINEERYK